MHLGSDRFLLVVRILQPCVQLLSWMVCHAPAKARLRETRGWESTRRRDTVLMLAAVVNCIG